MFVNGVEFLQSLGCSDVYPNSHQSNLLDRMDVCEAIRFFFSRGLGAEFYVANGEEFKSLIKTARGIQKR
jgi:hypothetical protein